MIHVKKILLFIFLNGLIIKCLFPQDSTKADTVKNWKFNGQGSFTFSQVHLDNWAAGGERSLSGLTIMNFSLQYDKQKISWRNNLDIHLGILKQGNRSSEKSDDKIDFSSKLGLQAANNFYYTALLNVKTQMLKGYDPVNNDSLISSAFSPAFVNLSFGMDYKYKEIISVYLSPVSGKVTIVANHTLSDIGVFGVNPGDKVKMELGSILNTTIQKEMIKNVIIKSKLELFSDYSVFINEIDIDWESSMNLIINKYLTTNIIVHLNYDEDISSKMQLKEVFGLGFTYKF